MASVALAAMRPTHRAVSCAEEMLRALTDRSPAWAVSELGCLALGVGANDNEEARQQVLVLPERAGVLAVDGPRWVRSHLQTQLQPGGHVPESAESLATVLSTIKGDCHAVAACESQTAIAYRSPMSSRPVFYAVDNDGSLLVASQIRAIRAVRSCGVDIAGLAPFLVPQLCDPAGSAWQDVHRLPPGCLLTWRDGELAVQQVSQVEPADTEAATPAELVGEFRKRLLAAVSRCSAPPDGLLLSGGIDSSALACSYAALGGSRARAYALTYDGPLSACDERRFVDDVEQTTRVAVSRLDGNRLLPLVAGFPEGDEPEPWPYASRNWTLLRHIAADAEQATATVLAGEGGDELLLGQVFAVADRCARGDDEGGRREIATFPDPEGTARAVRGLLDGAYDSVGVRTLRALGDVPSWLNTNYVTAAGIVDRLAVGYPRLDTPGQLATNYSRAVLSEMGAAGRVQCGGWWEDMGRKAGVALTYPFLDPDLAAWVWSLPPELLRNRGQEKIVLREALADKLPRSVARRTDKAEALAMLHAGLTEKIETVRDVARGGPLVDHRIIAPDRLLGAVDRYLAGDLELAPDLWATTSVNGWLEQLPTARSGGVLG